MNDRYKYQTIINNQDGVLYYNSIMYPYLEPTIDDIYIESTGENLVNLSYKFYGKTEYWFILALINNLGKGSFDVPKGVVIRILDPNNVANVFNKLKEVTDERSN